MDKTESQFNLKVKHEDSFNSALEKVNSKIEELFNLKELKEDLILYEFIYKKDSGSIIVITKYDSSVKDETLEKIKICHNSRFIVKTKTGCLSERVIDKQIGANFEPVMLHVLYGEDDKYIRTFNNQLYTDFKNFLKEYFKINSDISLVLKNNNKTIDLDKNSFDKKNNTYLSLKQLRLNDNNIIFIKKSELNQNKNSEQSKAAEELDEKINCIIKLEDDEDNHEVVTIKINKTFVELINKIKKKLNIEDNVNIRIRK